MTKSLPAREVCGSVRVKKLSGYVLVHGALLVDYTPKFSIEMFQIRGATALTGQRGQSVVDPRSTAPRHEATPSASRTSRTWGANGYDAGSDIAGSARTARGRERSHSRRRDNSKITVAFGLAGGVLIATGPVGGCAGLEFVKQLRPRG